MANNRSFTPGIPPRKSHLSTIKTWLDYILLVFSMERTANQPTFHTDLEAHADQFRFCASVGFASLRTTGLP